MELGTYIMAIEPVSRASFHKSLPSACVSVYVSLLSLLGNGPVKCILPFGARQQLGIDVPATTNTSSNRRIVGGIVL
jgi:hypothetical protein